MVHPGKGNSVSFLTYPVRLLERVPAFRWLIRALSTSIGQKLVMALTGLLLCGFLVAHLAGNLFLFVGAEAYNDYAHALHKQEMLLMVAELGLVALFLTHIGLAISTFNMNRRARTHDYKEKQSKQGLTVLPAGGASSFMFATGAVVLGFVILHVLDFTFEWRNVDGFTPFEKAIVLLKNPLTAICYALGCTALGVHLVHGFGSALQTLGLNHPKYNTFVRWMSIAFGWAIAVGFISFVLWAWNQETPQQNANTESATSTSSDEKR